MRIGLLIFLFVGVGCASPQSSGRTDLAASSPQKVCRAGQQGVDRDRATGPSCRAQSLWWNDVGDALSGAATAVRLPRP